MFNVEDQQRDTRSVILEASKELLQSRGYSGFSYADISERVGIRKASIHHHFRTKEKLGLALLENYHTETLRQLNELGKLEITDKLNAFFEGYYDIIRRNDLICPAGILEAEYNIISEAMQYKLKAMVDDMLQWLSSTLEEGRQQNKLTFKGDADKQAVAILASLQGGLQIARALGRHNFHNIIEQVKISLSMK